MTEEENQTIEMLIETTRNAIDTTKKVQENVELQDTAIAKLIDASKQLIDNNNRLSEFSKQQNQANKIFMARITVLEAFVFTLLCWEFYKVVIS